MLTDLLLVLALVLLNGVFAMSEIAIVSSSSCYLSHGPIRVAQLNRLVRSTIREHRAIVG